MISSLVERFVELAPTLLIGLLLSGVVVYGVTQVVPQVRTNESLSTQIAAVSAEVSARQTAEAAEAQAAITRLQGQLVLIDDTLKDAAGRFWKERQVDTILDRLYGYAHAAGVELTQLQAQVNGQSNGGRSAQAEPVNVSAGYGVHVLRLQVNGATPQLMNFMARIREASISTISFSNVAFSSRGAAQSDGGSLTFDVLVYISPHASGDVELTVPDLDTPTPVPPTMTPTFTPSPVPPRPTLRPTTTPLPSLIAVPTFTPMPTLTLHPTATATVPTPTPQVEMTVPPTDTACPGAAPSLFTAGETVVVDFNGIGALRIMSWIGDNGASTLTQVYNDDRLQLLAGPTCGTWEGAPVWYWYVESERQKIRGWAGEASPTERWMCPLDNPECAPEVVG